MNLEAKEWTTEVPWGRVALASWGDSSNAPVLLVHGYMDSIATFIPLLELLPDNYYYVAIDFPGHGKSEPYPPGTATSQLCEVEAMRCVVEHMGWESFQFICHSRGSVIGFFYNHLYPGKISGMIHIDPAPIFATYYFSHYDPSLWYCYCYETIYKNYGKFVKDSPKTMTYDEAVNIMVENRRLTEEQAKVILKRALISMGDDKFRLSWDPRMKMIASVPISEETIHLATRSHNIPMLIIEASENISNFSGKTFAENILEGCRKKSWCKAVTVTGGHDVHITNPIAVATHIIEFLNQQRFQVSKL